MKIFRLCIFFYIDCRFDCNKNGTIGGVCNKEDGFCLCKNGFYGEKCDKGKMDKQFFSEGLTLFYVFDKIYQIQFLKMIIIHLAINTFEIRSL